MYPHLLVLEKVSLVIVENITNTFQLISSNIFGPYGLRHDQLSSRVIFLHSLKY